jgi:signal transduction histidine kinase
MARLTRERDDALEREKATTEVLRVISSSPGALGPVFEAMLENAARICEAKFGVMFRFDGEKYEFAADIGTPPPLAEFVRQRGPFIPAPNTQLHHVMRTKQVSCTANYAADAPDSPPVRFGGARSTVDVPMLKDGMLMGAISIYRQEVRPFTNKQIALLQNLANQAVIAIENTRLLSELRQRTTDLSESLEQQTATSQVLNVINTSPTDTQPVFDAIIQSAVRLCGAQFGVMHRFDGERLHVVAHDVTPEVLEILKRTYPMRPIRSQASGRAMLDGAVIEIRDVREDPDYDHAMAAAGHWRSLLAVPMLRADGDAIGTIVVQRSAPGAFASSLIEMLQNFAAQAVIAIENTRLLNELRQRTDDLSVALEQQTATSEVLKVISTSPTDANPVFEAILESACRLCDSQIAAIFRFDGTLLHLAATKNWPTEAMEALAIRWPMPPDSHMTSGQVVLSKGVVIQEDTFADANYDRGAARAGGWRRMLGVPMFRSDDIIGVIVVTWREPGPILQKQVELLQTFAAQAVIAIENAWMFNELRQRTQDLLQSLDDLRTAQDRLVQTQKLASLGQLTAGIAHEIKNPLNFVNNFSGLSVELLDELREAVASGKFDDERRSEIAELTDTLRGNLDKIAQHGKRADSIVKNMLLHSREGTGEHRPVDINALVEESLNLAYHGARAEKQDFNITLERSFDPAAGEVDLFPQEITRVLLNLVSNGFYAATKRSEEANRGVYEPTLTAATSDLGHSVEIRIRDNGTGIPTEVKEKMFNPFFTTKPAGEGTGLGLSISHDIIVKQHGGTIEVDTQPGAFTEFRIVLPRGAATIAKSGENA